MRSRGRARVAASPAPSGRSAATAFSATSVQASGTASSISPPRLDPAWMAMPRRGQSVIYRNRSFSRTPGDGSDRRRRRFRRPADGSSAERNLSPHSSSTCAASIGSRHGKYPLSRVSVSNPASRGPSRRVAGQGAGRRVLDRGEEGQPVEMHRGLVRGDATDGDAEPPSDRLGDRAHGNALLGRAAQARAGRRLLQRQPEQPRRVEPVDRRPAVRAVPDEGGDACAAGGADQRGHEGAVARAVDGGRDLFRTAQFTRSPRRRIISPSSR